jgi:microcystin-dependent protein
LADRFLRDTTLNISPGGTKRQEGFEKLDHLVDDIYTNLNLLDVDYDNHLADTSDAHDASAISNVPAGGIAASDIQTAINELDTEKISKPGSPSIGDILVWNGTIWNSSSIQGVSVGEIAFFAKKTAPTGYLKANGAAVSRTTYVSLFDFLCPASDFTVTIASPAVFTLTSHGLSAGDPIRFTTTGGLPAGLDTSTTYYVISAGLTADAFEVSTTVGGGAVNTSGSQNGVHTLRPFYFGVGDGSTTFNIPDLRGEFMRGFDDGRGIDTSRVFGSAQTQDVQPHAHNIETQNVDYGSSAPNLGTRIVAGGAQIRATVNSTGTETRPRNISLLACIKY